MSTIKRLSVALALCAVAGVAAADNGDSSMNPYTGDSWAALQGHGHNLGERTPQVTVRIAKPARRTPSAANGCAAVPCGTSSRRPSGARGPSPVRGCGRSRGRGR